MATNAFNQNLIGFRNKLGDFARSFMFRIDIPSWLDDGTTLSMLARSTKLPSYKLKSEQIAFQGLKMNAVSVAEFDQTWNVSILADENQVLRSNIMKWMSYIYDAGTMEAAPIIDSSGGSYKKDNVYVSQLDRKGNPIITYKFAGLYPEQTPDQELKQEDTAPQIFNVTFKYDFYTYNIGDGSKMIDNSNKAPAIGKTDKKVGATLEEPSQVANKPAK